MYFQVKFNDGIKLDCQVEAGLEVKSGDWVIVKTDRVTDFGMVTTEIPPKRVSDKKADYPTIARIANEQDRLQAKSNFERLKETHKIAKEEIREHKLDMKLIKTHCTLDCNLIILLFTADGRVDFRQLLKSLSKRLSSRIELRQVGVRDETAVLGGIGTCGREFCCSSFLNYFESINVRTAKDQGLPLNPATISGACGRLKCCLKYEHEAYKDLQKGLPRPGSAYKTPEGNGKVIDVNYLKGIIRVKLFDDSHKIIEINVKEKNVKKKSNCGQCGGCKTSCSSRCRK